MYLTAKVKANSMKRRIQHQYLYTISQPKHSIVRSYVTVVRHLYDSHEVKNLESCILGYFLITSSILYDANIQYKHKLLCYGYWCAQKDLRCTRDAYIMYVYNLYCLMQQMLHVSNKYPKLYVFNPLISTYIFIRAPDSSLLLSDY